MSNTNWFVKRSDQNGIFFLAIVTQANTRKHSIYYPCMPRQVYGKCAHYIYIFFPCSSDR